MRLFDAAYEADRGRQQDRGVERAGVVSQPKLQLQLEFNVNNCLQLHLFICTPFAQLPHVPYLPTASLMVLSPVDDAVDDGDGDDDDDDALELPVTVPVPVPDSWPLVLAGDHVDWFRFDSHFIYAWDLATSTILFHFISFHLSFFLLPPPPTEPALL